MFPPNSLFNRKGWFNLDSYSYIPYQSKKYWNKVHGPPKGSKYDMRRILRGPPKGHKELNHTLCINCFT